MITRLYDPTSGNITVDGRDLKSYDVEYYRSKIAVVDQSPQLFNRPLAENIAYGMVNPEDVTYEEIEKAGKIANCDFIKDFREGYYTFAGYSGCDLSGGQLQRIAIARAAIRDPKILILDEATSSLDANNEKIVQEALEKLMKGRTVVVIAHRLSTIRNADNIVCMKNGSVVEQGTHDELMELKGSYHKLVSTQIIKDKKEEKEKENEDRENETDSSDESENETDSSDESENETDSSDKPDDETDFLNRHDSQSEPVIIETSSERFDEISIDESSTISNKCSTLDSGNESMTSELDNINDVTLENDGMKKDTVPLEETEEKEQCEKEEIPLN